MADFIRVCLPSLLLLMCGVTIAEQDFSYDLRMPDVSPKTHDTYFCYSTPRLPEKEIFITAFEPHAQKETAHHMLLFGCASPGYDKKDQVWNCGEMSSDNDEANQGPMCQGSTKILYAWAMDAPDLKLPEGVGFAIGGDTDINYLVLQVHYGHIDKFLDGKTTDNSGMTLHFTPEPLKYQAGVYLMATDGKIPKDKTTHLETACIYRRGPILHPFAFRVHTHKLGKVVAAYRVEDDRWTEIGRRNPQLPQMFYPIKDKSLEIHPGDVLAARCTMVNNLDHTVYVGATMADEMCNFYMMYYTNGKIPQDSECFSARYQWSRDLDVPVDVDKLASTVPADAGEKPMDM
ncbi:probable peptidylglycine alpha-hydroxylating monooxygenase 1 [Ptychodera flava]|uniref:probable peptidylglycine alpha-hydroxylating monooxygenase 1 n=1 Tax=Ptychodera flava TaxID=63121 RepID=UPI003969CD30